MKRRRASQTGSLNHMRPQVKPERSPSPTIPMATGFLPMLPTRIRPLKSTGG